MARMLICLVPLLLCGCMAPAATWLDQGHADIDLAYGMTSEQKADAHVILERIATLAPPTEPADAGGMITAGALIAAPFTGGFAPLTAAVGTALGAWVSARRGRRRTINAVRSIVGPLDAGRRRDLEATLASDPAVRGDSFIVIDKAAVAPVHAGNGAASLIAGVTGK